MRHPHPSPPAPYAPRAGALLILLPLLAALATLPLGAGCGGRSAQPVLAAPVRAGVPRYQHQLSIGFDCLCELRGGRLRCRGSHPLMELDGQADVWMPCGDGFDAATSAGLGLCALRAGRALCWSVEFGDEVSYLNSPAERVCTAFTFSGLRGVRELAMTDDGGCAIPTHVPTLDGASSTRLMRCSAGRQATEPARPHPPQASSTPLACSSRGAAAVPCSSVAACSAGPCATRTPLDPRGLQARPRTSGRWR